MIISLRLTNFKKHESLFINIGAGLSALKGANEAGKSTIYHAITYAMFGARALPLTLAETVTYLKPESSLKVELVFSHNSVTYTIIRSKNGCVLTAEGLSVNGQTEVTKYVEGLFGVNADAATKIMIASQNGLRGALEGKGAVALIERLANISLIDDLITKAQDQLPCGSTKAMSNSVAALEAVPAPVLDTTQLTQAVTLARADYAALELRVAALTESMSKLDEKAANKVIAEATRAVMRREVLKNAQNLASKAASVNIAVYNSEGLETLPVKIAKQSNLQRETDLYSLFTKHIPSIDSYAANLLDTDLGTFKNEGLHLVNSIRLLQNEELQKTMLLINEDQCSLCGKDLQDVPEVVRKNAENNEVIAKLSADIKTLQSRLDIVKHEIDHRESLKKRAAEVALLAAKLGDRVRPVDETQIPWRLMWVAEVPTKDDTDYKGQLAALKKQKEQYDFDLATQSAAKARLVELQTELDALVIPSTVDADAVIATLETLRADLSKLQGLLQIADSMLQAANSDLTVAKMQHDMALKFYNDQVEIARKLKADIVTYETNNELIKALREARPVVAAKLWTTVLTTISSYFSSIRGTQSVVTMTTDSFLVDGKPAEALSGSTLDSLGLAIRIALGKTFLPSVDFLLLDEPASGMDDSRELAMLGVLATCNYQQVLVVTHSSLADSFAQAVIQI